MNSIPQPPKGPIYPLETVESFDPLLEKIGDSRFVLLGQSTYGTREFYDWRARLTERLIKEKGFSFIAVEGDWSDFYEVNRYVKGKKHQELSVQSVLHLFKRWPTWMWANEEMEEFVTCLRELNKERAEESKVGIYGLDMYGLWESMDALMSFANRKDPINNWMPYEAFKCFEPFGRDPHAFGFLSSFVKEEDKEEAIQMLVEMRSRTYEYQNDAEDFFHAQQNALTAMNAESYYKILVQGNRDSWNLRDAQMAETFDRLTELHGPEAKGIIWAHNSHIGDARGTDMAKHGVMNLGQFMKERHEKKDIYVIGFCGYQGETLASQVWGAPALRMEVPPAADESWNQMFHTMEPKDKIITIDPENPLFQGSRFLRSVGTIYTTARDFLNYVPTDLTTRYNALIFIDESTPLRPLPEIEPDHEFSVETCSLEV